MRCQGLLFAALLLGAALFHQPREYDNTSSRYMLLAAMVDEGRLSIDSFAEDTVDRARFGGHYYSNKAIGLSAVAAPLYWVLRRAKLVGPVMEDPAARYLVRVGAVSLPFALLGVLLLRVLLALGAGARNALWACVSYGFGTIALNHATIFSGHETAAFFLFSAFAALLLAQRRAQAAVLEGALGGLAGLCAGLAVLCDHICAFAAAVLLWYALGAAISLRAKAAFVAGAAACVGLLAGYNRSCFGDALSLAYAHNDFPGFSRGAASGLFGISTPRPAALAGLVASPSRGILFTSPVLLLALPGLAALARDHRWRRELAVLVLAPAITTLACAGFYAWDGGWTFGPRYLTAVLPFLAVPLAFAAGGGSWFPALLGLSAFQIACAQIGWPHADFSSRNPIAELIVPLLAVGGTSQSLLGGARPGALGGGLLQYALLGVPLALAFRGCARSSASPGGLSPAWRLAAACWAAVVAACLLFLRSPDQARVHLHRARLLNDAAWALGSPTLAKAAQAELLEVKK